MPTFDWITGRSVFVEAGGHRLEGACFGPPPSTANTIVLLHEGLGSVAMWKDFPDKLVEATGMGIFAYSRAGYGKSSPASLPLPVDYMAREAIDVLPGVLNAIGFRKGVLMGHSDGATIAAIHAGSVEDFRVRGIILMAPHFFTEPIGLKAIRAAKRAYEEGDLRRRLSRYHDDVDCAFRGWNEAWLNPDFTDWNVSEVIDYLRIPVLAIQGRGDEYGTLAQIGEIENRIYSPLETAVLDSCGHSPHRDQPEETLALVSEFCWRLDRIESEAVSIGSK